jgi:hypothetical protein
VILRLFPPKTESRVKKMRCDITPSESETQDYDARPPGSIIVNGAPSDLVSGGSGLVTTAG